jgi:putative transposase
MTLARKSVRQSLHPRRRVLLLMEDFRRMTNECIQVGLEFERNNNDRTPSMKKLSLLAYGGLRRYECFSQYRLCAISKAAGILSSRRKSINRGFPTKVPYLSKPGLVSCYGFKIGDGSLVVHLGADTFESIPLTAYSLKVLSDPSLKVRSFTLTETTLSLCISNEVQGMRELTSAVGIDRNLTNITSGNDESIIYYDMTGAADIAENTRSIVKSFKRNDVRIQRSLSSSMVEEEAGESTKLSTMSPRTLFTRRRPSTRL